MIGYSKQSGLAMVIVIWVLSLLTIMAGSFALTMRRESTVISAVKDNAIVQAMAETGLSFAQEMLSLPDKQMRWHADGSIYRLNYHDAEIRVRLISEQGKIDINKASEESLTALLSSTTAESSKQQEIVSAILDWRDKDDEIHINGAEKEEYEDAELNYSPANKDFQLIEELQMVLGMNSKIYKQLKPLITVYSKQKSVDLNVASKKVIETLVDIDPVIVDQYIQQRTNSHSDQQPAPDFPMVGVEGKKQNENGNEVYTVISEAQLYSDVSAGIQVTLKRSLNSEGSGFKIVSWQQIEQKQSLFDNEMTPLLVRQNEPEDRD